MVLNLIDNIAAVKSATDSISVKSISCTANADKIDKEWSDKLESQNTGGEEARSWWNSGRPRKLRTSIERGTRENTVATTANQTSSTLESPNSAQQQNHQQNSTETPSRHNSPSRSSSQQYRNGRSQNRNCRTYRNNRTDNSRWRNHRNHQRYPTGRPTRQSNLSNARAYNSRQSVNTPYQTERNRDTDRTCPVCNSWDYCARDCPTRLFCEYCCESGHSVRNCRHMVPNARVLRPSANQGSWGFDPSVGSARHMQYNQRTNYDQFYDGEHRYAPTHYVGGQYY